MTIDLVLGLGNPGVEYALTRHNVGYRSVAEILQRRGSGVWLARPSYEVAVITIPRIVVVARPLTFMNRSGEAARRLLGELELEPEHMLVVVDDVDLPLAQLRLRLSGGPGTHNGLRDLCREVGTDFPRLRIGVGGTETSEDLADYVTSPFTAAEFHVAESAIKRAADAVETALREGVDMAMNVYNRPAATQ